MPFDQGFPRGLVVKNLDSGSIPGMGKSQGEGNGSPLQYSCLGNLVDRGAWQVIVHGDCNELDMTYRLNKDNSIPF